MFKKPRTVLSVEQLQAHLERKGGSANGVYWQTEVERGEHGEVEVESEFPVEGTYVLEHGPEGIEPLIGFKAKGSPPESLPIIVHDEDVLRGVVQVIARRLK